MKNEKMSFMAACKDFFGLHPDQKSLQFGAEIKALPNSDRIEIADGLSKIGYNIDTATIERKAA
jgi:hypothetical protein